MISAVEIPTRQSFVVKMVEHRADLTNAIRNQLVELQHRRLVDPPSPARGRRYRRGYCFLVDGVSYIAVIAGRFCTAARIRWISDGGGGVGVLVCAIGLVLRRSVIGLDG